MATEATHRWNELASHSHLHLHSPHRHRHKPQRTGNGPRLDLGIPSLQYPAHINLLSARENTEREIAKALKDGGCKRCCSFLPAYGSTPFCARSASATPPRRLPGETASDPQRRWGLTRTQGGKSSTLLHFSTNTLYKCGPHMCAKEISRLTRHASQSYGRAVFAPSPSKNKTRKSGIEPLRIKSIRLRIQASHCATEPLTKHLATMPTTRSFLLFSATSVAFAEHPCDPCGRACADFNYF